MMSDNKENSQCAKRICSVLNKDDSLKENTISYKRRELLIIFGDYIKSVINENGINPLMFKDVVLVKRESQPDNFQNDPVIQDYFENYLKNKYSIYIVVRKKKSYTTRHSNNYVFSLKSQNFYAYSDSEGNFTLDQC